MTVIKPREMQLADTVRMTNWDGPWGASIVKQITDGQVTIFRPYGTTADFSYTGGVICYIGVDEYKIQLDSSVEYELLNRKSLK